MTHDAEVLEHYPGFYEEASDLAMAYASTIIDMKDDAEVLGHYKVQGVDWAWHQGLDIANDGPQNDMQRRVVAAAMVRRLKGK